MFKNKFCMKMCFLYNIKKLRLFLREEKMPLTFLRQRIKISVRYIIYNSNHERVDNNNNEEIHEIDSKIRKKPKGTCLPS